MVSKEAIEAARKAYDKANACLTHSDHHEALTAALAAALAAVRAEASAAEREAIAKDFEDAERFHIAAAIRAWTP